MLDSKYTLESLTQAHAQKIMQSKDFLHLVQRLRQLKDGSRPDTSPLRFFPQLRGKSKRIIIYEFLDGLPDQEIKAKLSVAENCARIEIDSQA